MEDGLVRKDFNLLHAGIQRRGFGFLSKNPTKEACSPLPPGLALVLLLILQSTRSHGFSVGPRFCTKTNGVDYSILVPVGEMFGRIARGYIGQGSMEWP